MLKCDCTLVFFKIVIRKRRNVVESNSTKRNVTDFHQLEDTCPSCGKCGGHKINEIHPCGLQIQCVKCGEVFWRPNDSQDSQQKTKTKISA